MLRPLRPLLAIVVAWLTLTTALVIPALRPAPAAAAGPCPDVFSESFRADLAQRFPGRRVTAAVYDTRSGCWHHLNRGLSITTASVIKAQFLAGILLRAQEEGRPVSEWERNRIAPMMWLSHNPPSSDLFVSLGGVQGQERLDDRFGLRATTSTSKWGATISTAEDRTRLALALLYATGPLTDASRRQAWDWMTLVHPTQTWGITAGVPDGWTVALKNGFYPLSGEARWRLGSTGFVRNDASGQGYVVTVMTDQNPDHQSGQDLVEAVSLRIAGELTDGEPAERAVDRARCVAVRSGETWSQVAARLGTSDVEGVRTVAGGPASPLTGMRACHPVVEPAYDPDGATARFVDAVYRTFLDRAPTADQRRNRTLDIDSGRRTRLDLTTELSRSSEWIGLSIEALYQSAFGRPADAAGKEHWRQEMLRGMRLSEVAARFYASTEFRQRVGGGGRDWVRALYREILRREADAGGEDHWVRQLEAGMSRVAVASGFYASIESRRDRVRTAYDRVLGRAPDDGGMAHWSSMLRRVDDIVIDAHLAASTEYFQISTGTTRGPAG